MNIRNETRRRVLRGARLHWTGLLGGAALMSVCGLAGAEDCQPQWADGLFAGSAGLNGWVEGMGVHNDGNGAALFVAGDFTTAGGQTVNRVAKWDGSAWSPLQGTGTPGTTSTVIALGTFDDGGGEALYVGGAFVSAGGQTVNRIAKWDGSEWSPLVVPGGTGVNSWVRSMAVFNDGNGEALYVGGDFSQAGGMGVNRIARWDGTSWSTLAGPSGTGVSSGGVFHLEVFDDGNGPALYAAGSFASAGGVSVSNVAKWDGTSWLPLSGASGTGVNGAVNSMAVFDDGTGAALYVAGNFITAGGLTANRIAKWDGNEWSTLTAPGGTGLPSVVYTLTVFDDGNGEALYAGGGFTTAGGHTVNRVARWDGSDWSAMEGPSGVGMNSLVIRLASFDDGNGAALYAGGGFSSAGGSPTASMARWVTCPSDGVVCEGDLTGPALDGVPDGVIDSFDLNYYVGLWLAADPAADLTGAALDGVPDGTVNVFDLNYYVGFWLEQQGVCP